MSRGSVIRGSEKARNCSEAHGWIIGSHTSEALDQATEVHWNIGRTKLAKLGKT